jgi:hypothetical protein
VAEHDQMPEEPNLTPETLRDPFWQVVIGAKSAEMDACERALTTQATQDKEWYRLARDRLAADGMVGQEFNDALKREIQAYFAQPRKHCVCGEHREGGLR